MHWKNLLTCTTSALALTIAAGAAYAQADQQQVETVVVTGIRASLASAETIKKNSDQFQDSIVSEDIGKLPDNKVIEALQHVTGVQISILVVRVKMTRFLSAACLILRRRSTGAKCSPRPAVS